MPLGQVKCGKSSNKNANYPDPQDDPLYPLHIIFDADENESRHEDINDAELNESPQTTENATKVALRANEAVTSLSEPENQPTRDSGPIPEAVANSQKWYKADSITEVNTPLQPLEACVDSITGGVIREGTLPDSASLYDLFLSMFPVDYLSKLVRWTNFKLQKKRIAGTTSGEVLKFFGALILMTRTKFGARRELWRSRSASKYLPLHDFSKVISRNRFELLLSNLSFCTPFERTATDRSAVEREKWKCIEPFIESFNRHRLQHVNPVSFTLRRRVYIAMVWTGRLLD